MKNLKNYLLSALILAYFAGVKPNDVFAQKIRKSYSCSDLTVLNSDQPKLTLHRSYSWHCIPIVIPVPINSATNSSTIFNFADSCSDFISPKSDEHDSYQSQSSKPTKHVSFSFDSLGISKSRSASVNYAQKASNRPTTPRGYIKQTVDYMHALEESDNLQDEEMGSYDITKNPAPNIFFIDDSDSIELDTSQKISPAPTEPLPYNDELSDEGKQYFKELSEQTQQFLENKCNKQPANTLSNGQKGDKTLVATNYTASDITKAELPIRHRRSRSFIPQDWSTNFNLGPEEK